MVYVRGDGVSTLAEKLLLACAPSTHRGYTFMGSVAETEPWSPYHADNDDIVGRPVENEEASRTKLCWLVHYHNWTRLGLNGKMIKPVVREVASKRVLRTEESINSFSSQTPLIQTIYSLGDPTGIAGAVLKGHWYSTL